MKKLIVRPKLLSQSAHFDVTVALSVLAVIVLVGTVIIFRGRAAGPFASLDLGAASTVASPATSINDGTASGGSYVQFGSGVVTPPPSGTSRCPAYPAFPDASCTGVLPGIARNNSGSITTAREGQVIENLNISGSIRVNHSNVIIRNVKITQPGGAAIYVNGPTGLVIEDCELDGTGNPSADSAIAEHNYTMRRCNIHHFGEGPRVNGNVTLEDNFIHSFTNYIAQGAHQDGVQITSGGNITIRHNYIVIDVDGANGDIFTCCYGGGAVVMENNLLGGGNWAATGGGIDGVSIYPGTKIINNHFTTMYHIKSGYFGPIAYAGADTVSGNVWHDDYGGFTSGEFGPLNRQYPSGDGPRKGQPL